jgi:two-component system, probable response regulator PhcQ
MKPDKILYVDDEPMALKYFERLVSPMAPVLTALSVEEGKILLDGRAGEIAILISDQRMPGAQGNDLLRYARENYPLIVRMLTTAYSELGSAIEAINSGEIYRYINKPWDLESLKADLKNALELADLRSERDTLLWEKMGILQQQLLAKRVSQLTVICAGFIGQNCDEGLHTYLDFAARLGCGVPQVNWNVFDHSDLMQAEAHRDIAIGRKLSDRYGEFGADKSPAVAAAELVKALPENASLAGNYVRLHDAKGLYGVLDGETNGLASEAAISWLAWLTWYGRPVTITTDGNSVQVNVDAPLPAFPLAKDWLACCIEKLSEQLH